MLLTSVIIVLREVLEAALLISILSALSVRHGFRRGWIGWALSLGCLAAVALGYGMDEISGWFDGVGQEVSSAAIQFSIYAFMAIFVFLAGVSASRGKHRCVSALPVLMAAIVTLAIAREGFEILIYILSYTPYLGQLVVVLVGSAIGAGIGISAGVLIYYLLCALSRVQADGVSLLLLVLISAGLCSQAALLLIQADWLPSQLPLWDSSFLIAEDSVVGQILYALIGYEATPSLIQAGFYFGGATIILVIGISAGISARSHKTAGQNGADRS